MSRTRLTLGDPPVEGRMGKEGGEERMTNRAKTRHVINYRAIKACWSVSSEVSRSVQNYAVSDRRREERRIEASNKRRG